MAIFENLLAIIMGGIANYFLIYQKLGKFYGNIGFAGLGLFMMSVSTGIVFTGIGWFILIAALISIISDYLTIDKT